MSKPKVNRISTERGLARINEAAWKFMLEVQSDAARDSTAATIRALCAVEPPLTWRQIREAMHNAGCRRFASDRRLIDFAQREGIKKPAG